ncbi:MAG TPA: multicopper oxidase domain-containing protein, partial [Thermaerobacter sp.]
MKQFSSGRSFLAAGLLVVLGLALWTVYPQAGATSGTESGAAQADAGSQPTAAQGEDAPDYEVFPAGTGSEGQTPLPEGQQLARYRVENGVKVFELTALPVKWSTGDKEHEAWTFNGTVPGPQIRVQEGDRVRVIVKNKLPEPTVVHWHGMHVTNAMD